MIAIEDFAKIELKVAEIVNAEKVEGSDKLLKLKLNLGEEERQVVAGIAQYYKPEKIIGKQIVIVANLEPRTLMGVESQGMLLAADDNQPVLLIPDKEVSPGSKVR